MITKDKLENAKKIYDMLPRWKFANKILTDFFSQNSHNTSESVVFIKVALIDSLYNTNIKDKITLAQHIFKLNDLDNRLKIKDATIVEDIANCNGKNLLSFASKFAHFHNKDFYPIYDKYVVMALNDLVKWKDTRIYRDFIFTINEFRKSNSLQNVAFEEIDKILWLYGMMLKIKKGKKDINKEIMDLYRKNTLLFNSILEIH